MHAAHPEGSQRNAWSTVIDRVEPLGDRVRLRTRGDPALTVEVTDRSRHELGLEPGREIWVAFKATEMELQPYGGAPLAPTEDHDDA